MALEYIGEMSIRSFFYYLREILTPPSWRFNCAECRDTGWVSSAVRLGAVTYHTCDLCTKCRGAKLPDDFLDRMAEMGKKRGWRSE